MSPSGSTRSTSPARRAARGMSGEGRRWLVLDEHGPAQAPHHLRALGSVDPVPGQHDGDRPGTVARRRRRRTAGPPTGGTSGAAAGATGRAVRRRRRAGARRAARRRPRRARAACPRRLAHGERGAIGEDLGEIAPLVGREMLQHQDRRRQRRGQRRGAPRRGRPVRRRRRRSRSPVSRPSAGGRSRRSSGVSGPRDTRRHVPRPLVRPRRPTAPGPDS